jgi:hypothetical protein
MKYQKDQKEQKFAALEIAEERVIYTKEQANSILEKLFKAGMYVCVGVCVYLCLCDEERIRVCLHVYVCQVHLFGCVCLCACACDVHFDACAHVCNDAFIYLFAHTHTHTLLKN